MNLIAICASNSKIIIQLVNNLGWCKLFLVCNTYEIELGAENIKIIIPKLLSILDRADFQQQDIQHEENNYIWGMSLWEKHTSIYSKKLLQGIELVFCDGEANKIATLNSSNEECDRWKLHLKIYKKKFDAITT